MSTQSLSCVASSLRNCKSLAAVGVLAAGALAASSANAASIGINFAGYISGYTASNDPKLAVGSGNTAGVVAQTNWNDVGFGTQATNTVTSFPALVDSSNAATAVTGTFKAPNYFISGYSGGTPQENLLYSYLDGNPGNKVSVILAGIPYAKYDLYLYVASDHNEAGALASFQVNGVDQQYAASNNVGQAAVYTLAGNTDTTRGNYILFSGLTAASLTIIGDTADVGGTKSSLDGIQIVDAVPEPTSLALIGVGAILGLRRRRA